MSVAPSIARGRRSYLITHLYKQSKTQIIMIIKNLNNGQEVNVANTSVCNDGFITAKIHGKEPSPRYYNNYPMLQKLGYAEDGRVMIGLADGWVVVGNRQPNGEAKPASDSKPATEPEPVVTPTATPTPAPQAPSQQAMTDAFAALTPLFAGVQANVQAAVMEQMRPIIEQLQATANMQARVVRVQTPQGNVNTVSGAVCADFDAMVQTLIEGDYIYMHGPAGCGKSYTAMQLAEALDLQFYAMQQLLYEHQVVGFVDANGTRHETPFSMAWQNGGLVLLDEMDGSAPEAAICVNNALANGVIDLPGLGNVKAHPDFRVVAAGNTTMTGASVEYTARQVLDASTIDRFMFVQVDYDERIELLMANGDQEIVDFAHDVRQAIERSGLYALISYRCIKRLGNVNLQNAWGDGNLLKNSFAKSLGVDELRLIYGNLTNTENRWAKALKLLTRY